MKRAGSRWTWVLIGVVCLAGLLALVVSLGHLPRAHGEWQGLVLFIAVILQLVDVDLFTYQPRTGNRQQRRVTVGLAGTFLVIGYYGMEVAVSVALLQAVVSAVHYRPPWYKGFFNAGLYTTTTFVAGVVYEVLGGFSRTWDLTTVISISFATGLYFLIQSLCISTVICLSTRSRFRNVWSDSFGWMTLQQALIGVVGLLLGRCMRLEIGTIGMLLLLAPIMLFHYSYKVFAARIQTYVGQIEQANTELADLNAELRATNDELIQTLGSVLDARDRYTFGHSAQVAMYSVALGEKLGLPPCELERLRQAALLHDIGKVGIPEGILFKAGPLNPEERRIMQTHAEIGYLITSQVHSLAHVAEIIRQHHEWIGGGGYPRNLKGEQILLPARIISVADALDTLISDRPYRKGKPAEVAFQEIRRCTGTQFDPGVVEALEHLIRERGGLWFGNSAGRVRESALALEVAASMATAEGGAGTA